MNTNKTRINADVNVKRTINIFEIFKYLNTPSKEIQESIMPKIKTPKTKLEFIKIRLVPDNARYVVGFDNSGAGIKKLK